MRIALLVLLSVFALVLHVNGMSIDPLHVTSDDLSCLTTAEILTNSIVAAGISFFADYPRENRTFDPNKVEPFTIRVLFDQYYGEEASIVEFKKAFLQMVYPATLEARGPVDRDQLRRNLYSYIKAGSYEYARARLGELFQILINEYAEIYRCDDYDQLFEALEVECYKIRNEVGDERFSQFFGLGVGSTLAFAIDDTGSMSGEIEAAKKRAQTIVDYTKGTLDAPQDFVLVPFNDPDVGPVTVTSDAQLYNEALGKLYAHGGGDSPELSMRGIQLAIENSRPGSTIYVITDETAKDYKLQDTVIARARQKSIAVNFMLTNDLYSCPNDGDYKKCMGLYKHIAKQTDGYVLVISRRDIFRATDIVQSYTKQGVVLLKQVELKPTNDTDEPIQKVQFQVDSTIRELIIEMQGDCEETYLLAQLDLPWPLKMEKFGDVSLGTIDFDATGVQQYLGPWELGVKVTSGICKVKVQAKSTLGFVLNVFTKKEDETKDSYMVSRQDPYAGESVKLVAYPYGLNEGIHEDIRIKLVTEEGQYKPIGGTTEEDTILFTFPDGIPYAEPLRVMVEGRDSEGHTFERLMPQLIRRSHVKITCDLSDLVFVAGEEATADITIENIGPDDEFLLTISDAYSASLFAGENSKDKKVNIANKGKITEALKFNVDENTRDGTAIKVTLTAKGQHPGSFQYTSCDLVVGQKKRPRIEEFTVSTTINARFAETVVTSLVTNDVDVGREAEFDILLPSDAFITGIVVELHNETIVGEIEEKKQAEKIYRKAKARGVVAGHVAARDTSTQAFRTSMFVEARQDVKFILTYQQLLKRVRGRYEYALALNFDQPIRRLNVDIDISEEKELKFVRIPEMKTTSVNLPKGEKVDWSSVIFSPDRTQAHVNFEPDTTSQTRWSPRGLSGVFTVEYDVTRLENFGQITVDNGYFAQFFAPPDLPPTPKLVVFVIDISGSMYGYKMRQTREALIKTLRNLKELDRFNLVLFGDDATPWMSEMTISNSENIEKAIEFVNQAVPRGGTNLMGAIEAAIEQLEPFIPDLPEPETTEAPTIDPTEEPPIVLPTIFPTPIIDPFPDPFPEPHPGPIVRDPIFPLVRDSVPATMKKVGSEHKRRLRRSAAQGEEFENHAKMIVFMTDGRPSVGETDSTVLINSITRKNQGRFYLHTLGFGSLVDFDFLTKLAGNNYGNSRRVFEELDAGVQIKNFFDEVTQPILRDVKFSFPEEEIIDVVEPEIAVCFFESEMVVAGKYSADFDLDPDEISREPEQLKIIPAQIYGKSFEGDIQIDFDIDLSKKSEIIEKPHIGNFTEKLWAFLQVKDLLKQATLETNETKKEEVNQHALDMSLRYQFVTPLTSLIVLRSDEKKSIEEEIADEFEKEEEEEDVALDLTDDYFPIAPALERSHYESWVPDFAADRIKTADYSIETPFEEEVAYFPGISEADERIIDPYFGYSSECPDVAECTSSLVHEDYITTTETTTTTTTTATEKPSNPIDSEIYFCLNVDGEGEQIYNLLQIDNELIVNGVIESVVKNLTFGRQKVDYFITTLGIYFPRIDVKIKITADEITLIKGELVDSNPTNTNLSSVVLTTHFDEDVGGGGDFELETKFISEKTSVIKITFGEYRLRFKQFRNNRPVDIDYVNLEMKMNVRRPITMSDSTLIKKFDSNKPKRMESKLRLPEGQIYRKLLIKQRGKYHWKSPRASKTAEPGPKENMDVCWMFRHAEYLLPSSSPRSVTSIYESEI